MAIGEAMSVSSGHSDRLLGGRGGVGGGTMCGISHTIIIEIVV